MVLTSSEDDQVGATGMASASSTSVAGSSNGIVTVEGGNRVGQGVAGVADFLLPEQRDNESAHLHGDDGFAADGGAQVDPIPGPNEPENADEESTGESLAGESLVLSNETDSLLYSVTSTPSDMPCV